jgi:GTPase Era involved in 16S rRNA processing
MSAAEQPAQLLADVRTWLAAVGARDLAPETPILRLQQQLAAGLGERLDVADDPLLVVLLAGPTAVGKSSLINALAGADISPVGMGATTSAPVLFVYRADDVERLSDYGRTLAELAADAGSVTRHDRRELEHTVLIDTPDIDSVRRRHREITEGLVHAADLILFVTTPETYKTVESARWIAAQRGQRGMAFVLNKWDRAAIGPGYDRRDAVLRDFRVMLAAEGFDDPVVFLCSTLDPADNDNQFTALRRWLTEGLEATAAQALSDRRRRGAWRRIAGALAEAIPHRMTDDPEVKEVFALLRQARDQSLGLISADTAAVSTAIEGRRLPELPGLLGGYLRLGDRLTSGARRIRGVMLGPPAGANAPAVEHLPERFAAAAIAITAGTTAKIARDARTARLPFGTVGAEWAASVGALDTRLAALPQAVEADLLAGSRRLSFRRVTGTAILAVVESLVAVVVVMVLWRTGEGFVTGSYTSPALVPDAVALVVALLLSGQVLAGLLFPRLRARFEKSLESQAKRCLAETWHEIDASLAAQVEASARLAAEGEALLRRIEAIQGNAGSARDRAAGIEALFPAGDAE